MRGVAAVGLALLVVAAAGRARAGDSWSGGVAAGAAATVSGRQAFNDAWQVGLSVNRRVRPGLDPGLFVEYQSIIGSAPASSYWYGEAGLQLRSAYRRLYGRVDLGWALRHIAVAADGVADTVGGPLIAARLGATAVRTRRGSLGVALTYRMTRALGSEDFWIAEAGVEAEWRFILGSH